MRKERESCGQLPSLTDGRWIERARDRHTAMIWRHFANSEFQHFTPHPRTTQQRSIATYNLIRCCTYVLPWNTSSSSSSFSSPSFTYTTWFSNNIYILEEIILYYWSTYRHDTQFIHSTPPHHQISYIYVSLYSFYSSFEHHRHVLSDNSFVLCFVFFFFVSKFNLFFLSFFPRLRLRVLLLFFLWVNTFRVAFEWRKKRPY